MKEKLSQPIIPCIFTRLAENFNVALAQVKETMGHDDSIPFNAVVMISEIPFDIKDLPLFMHTFIPIAKIWNDGWGGESEISPIDDDGSTRALISKAEEAASKHRILYRGKDLGPSRLEFVCSVMAEQWLYIQKTPDMVLLESIPDDDPRANRGNIIPYIKRKKPQNI